MANRAVGGVRQGPSNIISRVDAAFRRLDSLESRLTTLVADLGKSLKFVGGELERHAGALGELTQMAEALADLAKRGGGDVDGAVRSVRLRAEAAYQAEKLRVLAADVASGTLAAAGKISDAPRDDKGAPTALGSYVVGVEYDGNGTELPPGRVVLQMAEMSEPYRTLLGGVAPGGRVGVPRRRPDGTDILDPDGKPVLGAFAVAEVYDVAPVRVDHTESVQPAKA